QAEDGIRDLIVTGVQTCALPICADFPRYQQRIAGYVSWIFRAVQNIQDTYPAIRCWYLGQSARRHRPSSSDFSLPWHIVVEERRSEERRVGTEGMLASWV